MRTAGREKEQKEYGVRWREFTGQEQRLTLKEKIFDSPAKRDKFIDKLTEKDNFYEIDSWLN